jgi:hypothetical protein
VLIRAPALDAALEAGVHGGPRPVQQGTLVVGAEVEIGADLGRRATGDVARHDHLVVRAGQVDDGVTHLGRRGGHCRLVLRKLPARGRAAVAGDPTPPGRRRVDRRGVDRRRCPTSPFDHS